MKKVLWVSRHEMTAEQRADLDRVMGGASRSSPTSTPAGSSCCAWMCAPGGCEPTYNSENASHENSCGAFPLKKFYFAALK